MLYHSTPSIHYCITLLYVYSPWRRAGRRWVFKSPSVRYKNELVCVCIYTGCPRRNVPDFGRVFLRPNYTDITQNTYIQGSMFTEILAREKCGLLWCLRSILCPWRDPLDLHRDNLAVACSSQRRPWLRNRCSECIVVGSQWTTMTRVRVFL